jgi:hypothetical protein
MYDQAQVPEVVDKKPFVQGRCGSQGIDLAGEQLDETSLEYLRTLSSPASIFTA